MPTRTLVKELCDVCYAEDGTETDATDRVRFGWQGRDYVLLVCEEHVEARDELQRLSEIATPQSGSARRPGPAAGPRPVRAASAPEGRDAGPRKTLFSQLSDAEKERFRAWAEMPNARRISDSRVEEWTAAGKP